MKSVSKNEEIWFLAGKRTPFGAFGGALKDLSATDLAVESAKAALIAARVSPEDIQHVVYGNVMQTSADAIYLPRHVGLRAGVQGEGPLRREHDDGRVLQQRVAVVQDGRADRPAGRPGVLVGQQAVLVVDTHDPPLGHERVE